jgi:hypothetical protein
VAKVKEITVSTGITVEVNKKWIRADVGMTLDVDTENTQEKRRGLYEKAFSEITTQLEKQIEDAIR